MTLTSTATFTTQAAALVAANDQAARRLDLRRRLRAFVLHRLYDRLDKAARGPVPEQRRAVRA